MDVLKLLDIILYIVLASTFEDSTFQLSIHWDNSMSALKDGWFTSNLKSTEKSIKP